MENSQPAYPTALKAVREPEPPTIAPYNSKESPRAFPTSRMLRHDLAGTAIVIACVFLPIILAQITTWTEEAARDRSMQALFTKINTAPHAITVAQGQVRPGLLDQHYYFVNGRATAPSDYSVPDAGDWVEYYAELGRLYRGAMQ